VDAVGFIRINLNGARNTLPLNKNSVSDGYGIEVSF